MKPTPSPRVVCSLGNRAEILTVQVRNLGGSTSYDVKGSEVLIKEQPQRELPSSVTSTTSENKGRKRGRNFESNFESPAKKNTFDDVPCKNPSSRCHGGQTDHCCENLLGEKVKCLT